MLRRPHRAPGEISRGGQEAKIQLATAVGPGMATAEPAPPASFREGRFLEMVAGRSRAWLDAATTMLDMNIDYRDNLDEIRSMALQATQRGPAVVDDAFDELKGHGMLRAGS